MGREDDGRREHDGQAGGTGRPDPSVLDGAVAEDGDAGDQDPVDELIEERPFFIHPQWTVGVVLVFAVAALLLSLANPLFLIIGAPFIITLAVWIGVKAYVLVAGSRDRDSD